MNYVSANDLECLLKEDSTVTLIDARTAEEFDEGHVPGAINVPIADLKEFASSRNSASDEPVVTMCGSTGRGEKAATALSDAGMKNLQVLQGGLKAWREAGLPVA